MRGRLDTSSRLKEPDRTEAVVFLGLLERVPHVDKECLLKGYHLLVLLLGFQWEALRE